MKPLHYLSLMTALMYSSQSYAMHNFNDDSSSDSEKIISKAPTTSPLTPAANNWTQKANEKLFKAITVDQEAEALKNIDEALAEGADINSTDAHGDTPLLCAIASPNPSLAIIEKLLKKNAKPNQRNLDGESPLGEALKYEHIKIADLLRRYGAQE